MLVTMNMRKAFAKPRQLEMRLCDNFNDHARVTAVPRGPQVLACMATYRSTISFTSAS